MTRISSGFNEVSICKWHECADSGVSFQIKGSLSVEMKLQALKSNQSAMRNLRSLISCGEGVFNIHRLDDNEVIKQVCALIRTGRLAISGRKTSTTEIDPKQKVINQILTGLPNKIQDFNFDGQTLRLISAEQWKSLSRNQKYQIISKDQAKQIIQKLIVSPFSSANEKTYLHQTIELFTETKFSRLETGFLLLRYSTNNYVRAESNEPAFTPSQHVQRLQKEKHWIEIELLGEDGKPIANQNYLVVTADQKQYTGTTDADGLARLDDIPAGNCQVSFPDLDKEAWSMA
ncbi:hypothetical protein [Methylomonas sp. AM2-LC]|uniref:hypothetical protein n=1 Tax=Methylomonas sp. AM2-LC TaxID=3153301 RepID=UPI0032637EAF